MTAPDLPEPQVPPQEWNPISDCSGDYLGSRVKCFQQGPAGVSVLKRPGCPRGPRRARVSGLAGVP